MTALPVISGGQAVRALESLGFQAVGQRGSHVKLRNEQGFIVIVPMHRELATGTLRSIIRQAGVDVARFVSAL